jgi:hypothetical protein
MTLEGGGAEDMSTFLLGAHHNISNHSSKEDHTTASYGVRTVRLALLAFSLLFDLSPSRPTSEISS